VWKWRIIYSLLTRISLQIATQCLAGLLANPSVVQAHGMSFRGINNATKHQMALEALSFATELILLCKEGEKEKEAPIVVDDELLKAFGIST